MSVVQKSTPRGGQRGSVWERLSVGEVVVLEAGTAGRECRRAKEEACGPKGEKVGWGASVAMMEVPEGVCVVVIRRGGGRGVWGGIVGWVGWRVVWGGGGEGFWWVEREVSLVERIVFFFKKGLKVQRMVCWIFE